MVVVVHTPVNLPESNIFFYPIEGKCEKSTNLPTKDLRDLWPSHNNVKPSSGCP